MTRNPPPVAAHLVRPPAARQRAPYAHLVTALRVLARQECTRDQLADLVQAQHPRESIAVDSIVRQLAGRSLIEQDGERYGLNDAGEQLARIEGLTLRHKGPAPVLPDVPSATTTARRLTASAADLAPPPPRPGSQRAADLPSRIGDYLHYRDGRITTMAGGVVQAARNPDADYQPTHNGRTRAPLVYGLN